MYSIYAKDKDLLLLFKDGRLFSLNEKTSEWLYNLIDKDYDYYNGLTDEYATFLKNGIAIYFEDNYDYYDRFFIVDRFCRNSKRPIKKFLYGYGFHKAENSIIDKNFDNLVLNFDVSFLAKRHPRPNSGTCRTAKDFAKAATDIPF